MVNIIINQLQDINMLYKEDNRDNLNFLKINQLKNKENIYLYFNVDKN
jgi:hypothetical protein